MLANFGAVNRQQRKWELQRRVRDLLHSPSTRPVAVKSMFEIYASRQVLQTGAVPGVRMPPGLQQPQQPANSFGSVRLVPQLQHQHQQVQQQQHQAAAGIWPGLGRAPPMHGAMRGLPPMPPNPQLQRNLGYLTNQLAANQRANYNPALFNPPPPPPPNVPLQPAAAQIGRAFGAPFPHPPQQQAGPTPANQPLNNPNSELQHPSTQPRFHSRRKHAFTTAERPKTRTIL